MRAEKLLHKIIGKASQIDKRIIRTLSEAAATLSLCKKLSISGIARSLPRPAKVKHLIKCIDRLFGNKNLHNKKHFVYQEIINWVIKNNRRPIIVVDWSGLTKCGEYHFIRAAVASKGRTLTLYEECHHLSSYTNHKIHKKFLLTLKSLLPKSCVPIIVTDAGFRNRWLKLASSLGWDFVGRIRNETQYKRFNSIEWKPIKSLYASATLKAKFLGQIILAKSNEMACNLYLIRQKKKYRKKCNLIGKKVKCSSSLKHAKREREPWLIASSIESKTITSNQVIKIYKKRMQIEESFRDIKNTNNGFCLRHCRSGGKERLNIALLIGALAMFLLWVIGMAAQQKYKQKDFQSNTIKNRSVLSIVSMGWQILERQIFFSWPELKQALQEAALCATI